MRLGQRERRRVQRVLRDRNEHPIGPPAQDQAQHFLDALRGAVRQEDVLLVGWHARVALRDEVGNLLPHDGEALALAVRAEPVRDRLEVLLGA